MKSTPWIAVLSLVALVAAPVRAQDLLVGDYYTNEIWRVAPDGTKTLYAQPSVPSGIRLCGFAFDSGGNLYAARLQGATANSSDPNNGILKVSPTGAITNFALSIPGLPTDTAVDSAGNIYVASQTSGQIRRFSPTGTDLGVFATVGGDAYNIDFDKSGNLYVASIGSGQVRGFSSAGIDLGVFATVGSASSLAFNGAGEFSSGPIPASSGASAARGLISGSLVAHRERCLTGLRSHRAGNCSPRTTRFREVACSVSRRRERRSGSFPQE